MKKQLSIAILGISTLMLTGCLEPNLPKCDDKETKNLLSQLFSNALKGQNLKYIGSTNLREDGFNKETEIRLCSADSSVSDGSTARVTYNVFWQNKKKSMFYVQITNIEE